jgi:beta-lactam-binding protein with PASTA domain/serine/threonine protein kinase
MESLTDEDPRSIGGYELRARLGQGGFGKVYLGLSPGGRAVAVKVLRPELGEDRDFLQRFRLEVSAAQQVNGLYTAPVVAAGLNERRPWVATAFVSGPSLERAVAVNGPLPELAGWRLLAGLVEALQAIHACGLVHRDLKPENVLLAADGPRVIDFGISKSLDGTAMTATGMIIGTPSFMAPEQADGEAVGPESDVFSLGCVLAYAVSGLLPFGGGSYASVLYRIVHKDPELDGVPPGLRAVIERCLAKAPRARPALAELAKIGRDGPDGPGNVSGQSALAFWPAEIGQLIREYEGRLDDAQDAPEPLTCYPSPVIEDFPPPDSVYLPLFGDNGQPGYASPTPATVRRRKPGSQRQPPANGGRQRRRFAGALPPWVRGHRWLTAAVAGSAVLAAVAVAVTPNVSAGTPVPQVRGDSRAQAAERLDAAGLKPVLVRRIDSRVAAGLVISTRPASGSSARAGQPVTVYLSAGPGVPAVHGLTWSRAQTQIKAAGFVPAERKEASAAVRAGAVIGTSPAAGGLVPASGLVTVDVSTGPASIALPDVKGVQAVTARAQLLKLGFTNVRLVTDPGCLARQGQVDRMSPAPGRYPPGKQVTLYMAAGGVAVPAVIGETGTEAAGILQQDGFTVRVDRVAAPAGQHVAPGVVYSEDPGAGGTVPRGALVEVFVQPRARVTPLPSISVPGIYVGL